MGSMGGAAAADIAPWRVESEGTDARATGGCEVTAMLGSSDWTPSLSSAPLLKKDVLVHREAVINDSSLILIRLHIIVHQNLAGSLKSLFKMVATSSAAHVGTTRPIILDIHGLAHIPMSTTTSKSDVSIAS
ncbi:hypothetical protein HAX54_031997 [Datura stramonium]|uniref:Uncharacterized protein n=1 Tax=Datura stramonium TaxID=4076 RepID=A0ABS8VAT8_DATST|nr:hypothetical protein [Datura stramonium]